MTFSPSFGDKLMRAIVLLLGSLPHWILRLIAGPQVTIDSRDLFLDVQVLLKITNRLPHGDDTIAVRRAEMDSKAYWVARHESVRHIRDITIPTRSGTIPARLYNNVEPGKPILGSVVYFHGGGFAMGSLDSTDDICRSIAANTNLVVVSIDYRLAPEHKFPAGIEDSLDAYKYVREHKDWGHLVACAGDSAGGTLTAVVSNETTKAFNAGGELPPPDFQLLLSPVTDLVTRRDSYKKFGKGFFLTEEQIDWYIERYLNPADDRADPWISPLQADLTGAPPTHLAVGGFDPLRDECIAYIDKLKASGVEATLQLISGHIHAWCNQTGVSETGRAALHEAVKALEDGMARAANAKASASAPASPTTPTTSDAPAK